MIGDKLKETVLGDMGLLFGEQTAGEVAKIMGSVAIAMIPANTFVALLVYWHKCFKNRRFLGIPEHDLINEKHKIRKEISDREKRIEKDELAGNETDKKMKQKEIEELERELRFIEIMHILYEHSRFLKRKGIYKEIVKKQKKFYKLCGKALEKHEKEIAMSDTMLADIESVMKEMVGEDK